MSLVALVAAAALRLVDPTGDAAGDGTLVPPTSPVYANAALFDLQEVALTPPVAEGEPTVLNVSMGALELDETQPGGFNRVVVDVYIDFAEGGAEATLAGPNMLMPLGKGWDYAVRVNPGGAFGTAAPLSEEQPVEWTALPLQLDGDTFVVTLPLPVGEDADLYAVSGLYDAFAPDTWRALTSTPSPWSFSSEEQSVPVLDVLAADNETQVKALRDGVLPAIERPAASGLPWLLLAMAGVLIAATGLWLRRLVAPPAEPDAAPEEADVADAEAEDEGAAADSEEEEAADGVVVAGETTEGPGVDAVDDEEELGIVRVGEEEPELVQADDIEDDDVPAEVSDDSHHGEPDTDLQPSLEDEREAALSADDETQPELKPDPQPETRSAYSRDWNFDDEEEEDEDELAGFGSRRPGRLHVESSDDDA